MARPRKSTHDETLVSQAHDETEHGVEHEAPATKKLKGVDFSGQDLRARDFTGQDLSNANFSNCILQGCNFTDCKLDGANFEGADTRWITWPKAKAE